MAQPPASTSYQKYRDGLMRMHRLFTEGKRRSEEVAKLRNEMDEPYDDLTGEEREELTGLSADLFDVEKITSDPRGAQDPRADAVAHSVVNALHSGRYAEALELLRGREAGPPSRVAFLRGRVWSEKGEPGVALQFFRHASRLRPENDDFKANVLEALFWSDPEAARHEIDRVLSELPPEEPALVIKACDLVFSETLPRRDDGDLKLLYERLIAALQSALRAMHGGHRAKIISEFPPLYGYVYSMLAVCHRYLGAIDQSYLYYTLAIGLDPLNDTILVARGAAVYGHSVLSTASAVNDFLAATRMKTAMAVPYHHLAHYFLQAQQFNECIKAVNDGLSRAGTDRLKSEMLEFRAIALAGVGARPEVVRAAFQQAERCDVTNERARSNLAAYENGVSLASQPQYSLNIDRGVVERDLPRPRFPTDIQSPHHQMAG